MRLWSATQPDHLKVSLPPAEDIESLLQSPSGNWSCSTRDPGQPAPFSREVVERLPLHP